jgi:hypothetical protein
MTSDPLQSDLTHPLSWIVSVAQHLDDPNAVLTEFRTELDSHAASIVAGRNVHVIRDSGRTVDVGPFTESLGKLKRIPVVDCAIAHDCPYSGTTRVIILYNALHIKEMDHNLLPPFVVRRKGNILNDIPKMQVQDPSVEDHSIFFPNDDVRIPLQLIDTISYFSSRKPNHDELTLAQDTNTLLEMNVNERAWDPHDDIYARMEECMLDFEGELIEAPIRDRNLFDISATSQIDEDRAQQVSMTSIMNSIDIPREVSDFSTHDIDEVGSFLSSVSTTLDPHLFAEALTEKIASVKFGNAVGASVSTPDYVIGATHAAPPKGIGPKELAKVFRIDLPTAKRTLNQTTQRCKRVKDPTLNRRYSSNDRMLRYKHISEFFYMDTFYATKKAGPTTRGNTCCQIFVTDKGFVWPCPMRKESDVHHAVRLFFKEIGVPDAIICDNAKAQVLGKTQELCRMAGTLIRQIEPHSPWANRAELYVGLFKKGIGNSLKSTDCPMVLWDYCVERNAKVNNVTAKDLFQLKGQTPHFSVTGEMGDISALCQFDFYDWCYFRDSAQKFPFPQQVLGRVLGPSDNVGNGMTQWILRADGKVLPRQTCRPLTAEELGSDTEKVKRDAFVLNIKRTLGDSVNLPPDPLDQSPDDHVFDQVFDEYEDDEEKARILPETDNGSYDELINAEITLPHQGKQSHGTVIGRAKNMEGNTSGIHNSNPILNTTVYDVLFPDGAVKQYSANVIAENMWAQVDDEGHQYRLLDEITNHRRHSSAVDKADQYIVSKRGKRSLRQTTVGWDLCVLWKDGSEQWIPLKDIKESNPLEVADYASCNSIADEPAFKWWVPFVLRKRDRIIAAVKQRVKKSTHKYGVEIPTSIRHAYLIDDKNKNTLWRDAIAKEMRNVSIAFELMEHDENLAPGYKPATCHLIFDIKMDFTRKARYVMDGHKTSAPKASCYAGVVSRESVRIAFTYAALNGVDVWAADIQNAYLQAPSTELYYITCGLEFGLENVGKRAKIVRALYGGKASGRDFRNHLRSCMQHLGFQSCLADADVWLRPATKSDGSEYYEYVLLYTDDALVISENAERILRNEIGKYFDLKEGSIGPPDIYLGGKVSKVTLENGTRAYSFSASQYVNAAVTNVETLLSNQGEKLPCRCTTPLSPNYRPEVDVTDELDPVGAALFQSLIGILRWMVELGRVDICLETSMMSSHLALPRKGHLDQVYHMFGYLKKNHNSELVFDPSDPEIDMNAFEKADWASTEFGNMKEDLPPNAPKARGQGFTMRAYVDADHAGDSITRRSRTGFLVYLNMAPIHWLSKKQNGIETSSFGSEFMAMKHCAEYVRGLRYKLRMMGIPCSDPTFIYGDNQSVLCNTTMPQSTLKKKSNSIAYHFVREGCAKDEWRTTYVNTHLNVADLLTKCLAAGEKRMKFIRMILHHL